MTQTNLPTAALRRRDLFTNLLLLAITLAALYLRVTGIYWGEYTYLHPDERFLVWVGTDITPMVCGTPDLAVESCPKDQLGWMSLGEYFNSAASTLNPQNRGHNFYVYGNLPMTLTRIVVQWVYGQSGFDEMTNVGRLLSAVFDVFSVLTVFLIGSRLYGRKAGLLGAAFLAVTVMHIQQSHFFTTDTFITFFTILSLYFAVTISMQRGEWISLKKFYAHPLFLPSLAFGLALGMAVASKLNAFLVAGMLPVALFIRLMRMPAEKRNRLLPQALFFLGLAALTSLVVFRICQPYAFEGPGFFNVSLRSEWLDSIKSLYAQQRDLDVDFPPQWQWARRSLDYSGKNLVLWGFGLPLGLLAWAGFAWAGWHALTSLTRSHAWQKHGVLWIWTAVYFGYQSLAPNPTMRYQMPVYPTLVLFAAWAVIQLASLHRPQKLATNRSEIGAPDLSASTPVHAVPATTRHARLALPRLLAILIGGGVLLLTSAWAVAFSQIYVQPMTRVAATRWIFNNIPGPLNLHLETDAGFYNQLLSFPTNFTIQTGLSFETTFSAKRSGTLKEVYLPHALNLDHPQSERTLQVEVFVNTQRNTPIARASLVSAFSNESDTRGSGHTLVFEQPAVLEEGQSYYLNLSLLPSESAPALSGKLGLVLQDALGASATQPLSDAFTLDGAQPFNHTFTPNAFGTITSLIIENSAGLSTETPDLTLTLIPFDSQGDLSASDLAPEPVQDAQPTRLVYRLEQPLAVEKDVSFQLRLTTPGISDRLTLAGETLSTEGDWDEGIPVRLDGYDPFGGIYPNDMELQLFWEDTPEKLEHLTSILDRTDAIVMSSNRRWGTHPRMPERYPMTTLFYRELLGCPDDQEVIWCYSVAKPGMFAGELGFELAAVFQSNPTLGPFEVNDQFADEAFTVYDHPKVMIFRKTAQYDGELVASRLGSVDLSAVIRKPPLRYASYPENLLLPLERLSVQLKGGTWSELFNLQSLLNRFQALAVIAWYGCVALLGLLLYPLVRFALPGLPDRGYPLARSAGLLLLAYLVWLAGSYQVSFNRTTISLALLFLLALSLVLGFVQRKELAEEWKTRRQYFLRVEGLFLAFFLFFLLVRLGNPDIWHPYKGGEKPMDFAYFNAVLKSTTFPPYDPWYAGGYLNYYYFGFVMVAVLVKWLGIVPAVAYNLILPTLFSLIALGAFSLAWNLYHAAVKNPRYSYTTGLAGALGAALFGNLGTLQLIFTGFQRLGSPSGGLEGSHFLERFGWGIKGFFVAVGGTPLPLGLGDWYWNPSRAIPGLGDVEPITEFPYFTVLYADLHAHLIALPLTLLALSFALSIVLSRARWKNTAGMLAGFFIGALSIGALRPTNTWDLPTYLAIGVVALVYSLSTSYQPSSKWIERLPLLRRFSLPTLRVLASLAGAALLVALTMLLYQPFASWYALGYSQVNLWTGPRTPLGSYLQHWGLFLFLIVSWLAWETRQWLASTPVSALNKLRPFAALIASLCGGLALLIALLSVKSPGLESLPFGKGIQIAGLSLILAVWAAILLLRSRASALEALSFDPNGPPPNLPAVDTRQRDAQRFLLFLVGTGLVLTLVVEIIVLKGDIGRMNTVFKFYLQVWTLFSICGATALGWLLEAAPGWTHAWRRSWQIGLAVLVFAAALYPILASTAKVRDRMVDGVPLTLDGLKFMENATYDWKGPMDLGQDYTAIRWMQDNVQGSPVLIEANLRDLYRWGSRFSIYTGLPSVVGWEWHQQQQRAINPGMWVSNRINEVDEFYKTVNTERALEILHKYQVHYIIVGQLERNLYANLSLEKFEKQDGILWNAVYRQDQTVIYEVIEP